MKKIIKKIQNFTKHFAYKILIFFHGKITGKIKAGNDPRIQIFKSSFDNRYEYNIYKVSKARIYTDRVHDMAIILDNLIVEGPSYQLRPINNTHVEKNIVFEKGTPRIKKEIKGTVLSLLSGGAGNNNYFHWMFDVLPRIGICEKVLDTSKIDYFLLPNLEKKFQSETLDILGIPKNKRLSSKNFRHISGSQIIATSHPYCFNNDASNEIQNIPIWISKWLKKNFLKNNISDNKKQRNIYIDRSDAESNTKNFRSITNEEEIKNFLKKRDFKFISLGNLPFKEQINIINNAEIVVGLHGAGFANFCFCKPKTKIIEFKSNTAGKMYENLAKSNNLIYRDVSCVPDRYNYQNQYGHIKVSIKELENKLESFN